MLKKNDPVGTTGCRGAIPLPRFLENHFPPFIPLVDNDNIQAGFDATEYFIKKGCSRIAFIGGPKKLFVTQDRLTGYEQALQEHNLPLDSHRTFLQTSF